MKPYTLDVLADELNIALRAIRRGQPTLQEAQQLTAQFREAFIVSDLFPNESGFAQGVEARLAVIQDLDLALERARAQGAAGDERLHDIPFLDMALQRSLAYVAGNLDGIPNR
ncbi:hypothetical protein CXB49_09910 [Chromobacterium sp. ATCC 53434]|uniref:hypothetical protein n=1 Tax=Chromobacterium TaxID=535 RepID=UPI000C75C1CC|nr:hypothetical protein [Chromobacterium sp. ATCC 53434]AUH51104.1 hypothetical protein CXB49_09910 [Chromobacterium sp. ATCC 53434]